MHHTHELELYPDRKVTQVLFKDVKNAAELRKSAVDGRINAALINPTMVERFHKTLTCHMLVFCVHIYSNLLSFFIYSCWILSRCWSLPTKLFTCRTLGKWRQGVWTQRWSSTCHRLIMSVHSCRDACALPTHTKSQLCLLFFHSLLFIFCGQPILFKEIWNLSITYFLLVGLENASVYLDYVDMNLTVLLFKLVTFMC